MKKYLLAVLVLLPLTLVAQDIRDNVEAGDSVNLRSPIIDPDEHVYGIPFGASEDDFITACGKPTGYVRLRGNGAGMIYGKSHMFIFEDGKLAGLRISHSVLDWAIAERLPICPLFDGLKWRLNNGIAEGTNLAEVKEILGDQLSTAMYKTYYTTDKARVRLDFSHFVQEGEGDRAHRLHAILVERK